MQSLLTARVRPADQSFTALISYTPLPRMTGASFPLRVAARTLDILQRLQLDQPLQLCRSRPKGHRMVLLRVWTCLKACNYLVALD